MLKKHNNIKWGVIYGLLAVLAFTIMSTLVKILGKEVPTLITIFFRFGISLLLILPWMIKNPAEYLALRQPFKIFLRSFFTILALICFFYALKYISLADALVLNNAAPLFVPVISYLFLKARTPAPIWIGLLLGFLGIIIVLKPDRYFFQNASFIGLASGLLSAISMILIRQVSKVTSIQNILFYTFLFGTLLSGLFVPFIWISLSSSSFFLLLAIGLIGALYQWLLTLSYSYAPVRITASLMFISILLGSLLDWLIWNKLPDFLTLIGIFLVILGGLLVVYFGQKLISKK